MMLATLLVAAALGQICPEPPSQDGPPPCAAANVPGCVPGYRRQVDQYGHVRYVCDARQAAPSPQPGPPARPAPPRYAPPPPSYAPPPPPEYAAGYRGAYEPAVLGRGRGVLGLVLMPGVASTVTSPHDGEGTGAFAVELRPSYGGARLRLAMEGGSFGRVAEVAAKYDFNDLGQIRPFVAVGLGGAAVDPDPAWRLEASVSAGLDLYVSRDFFFTLELKERAFAERSSNAYYGLDSGNLHQTAFFFGVGLYL